MTRKATLTLFVVAAVFASCTACQPITTESIPPLAVEPKLAPKPPTFLRVRPNKHEHLLRRVHPVHMRGTLQQIVTGALPFPVTLTRLDQDVDIEQAHAVRVIGEMTAEDFLGYLAGITGYRIVYDPGSAQVRVASRVAKSWEFPALALLGNTKVRLGSRTDTDGDSDDSGASDSGETGDNQRRRDNIASELGGGGDVWSELIGQVHCVMETGGCSGASADDAGESSGAPTIGADGSWVAVNRAQGRIHASGPAFKMDRLDKWLSPLEKAAGRYIQLDVAILDVRYSDAEGYGFDFDAVLAGKGVNTSGVTGRGLQSDNTTGEAGLLTYGLEATSGRFRLDLAIEQLKNHSNVQILNRARWVISSGGTAHMNSTESFRYISGQDVLRGDQRDLVATQISESSVGLELAVTAVRREDGQIALSVVPIISSLREFDVHTSGGQEVARTPRIGLSALISQAVTRSGRPVAIGGLISDQRRGNEASLGGLGAFLGWSTSSRSETVRRELLVVVVPHEVAA